MRDVAVIGIGLSKWGELWDRGIRDLFTEAGTNAIDNAGVDKIEAIFVGCMTGGMFTGQEHIGAMVAELSPVLVCIGASGDPRGTLADRLGKVL